MLMNSKPVLTSQRTQFVCITNTNRLMLYIERIAVNSVWCQMQLSPFCVKPVVRKVTAVL